jgi:hypothetical protein
MESKEFMEADFQQGVQEVGAKETILKRYSFTPELPD